jgi:pyruvate decarboxylase
MLLHHTLGNGDFRVFRDMAARVSEFVAELDEARTAAQLVDDAVVRCWVRSRPVYVWLPTDMVRCKVEGERLKTPLKLEYPPNDKEKEDYVTEVVLKHLRASKSAIVLVDACAIRHRVRTSTCIKTPLKIRPCTKSRNSSPSRACPSSRPRWARAPSTSTRPTTAASTPAA